MITIAVQVTFKLKLHSDSFIQSILTANFEFQGHTITRLKGFSPKREQRLWKLFNIQGRDFRVRD